MKCRICKIKLNNSDAYEYRGEFSCSDHFDEMVEFRDFERNEIIKEEDIKTKDFKGLDLDPNSIVGKENRKILRKKIEIAKKESQRLKNYEKRD